MADDKVVADAPATPVVEPLKEENKEEPKDAKPQKPVLDSNKPLTQQVDKILEQMPKEENEENEPAKPKEDSKAKETPEDATPSNDDSKIPAVDEDEPYVEPKELPTWQKYVLENLPTIQTVGHTGEGKDKVVNVKRVEDLPDDFEFADRRTEIAFSAALASQEVNARELLNKYNGQQQIQQFNEFKNQEAIDIQADIKNLQREGILPKFQYSEDDPKFNDDPAVKEANAIYALYEKTNQAYLDQFTKTGKNYRISYADAADKYYATQNRNRPNKPEVKPEVKQERNKVATQVSAPQSASPESAKKAMPVGSTMQDVLKLYKLGRI